MIDDGIFYGNIPEGGCDSYIQIIEQKNLRIKNSKIKNIRGMIKMEIPQELVEKVYQIVEKVKATGKIKKGTNEVTKASEKATASLVVIAKDVNPKEIVMHLPVLCKEKGIVCVEVPSKEELGVAAGLAVSTVAVAIVNEGDAKKEIADLKEKIKALGN